MLLYNFRDEDEIKRDMLLNIENTVDRSPNSIVHDALSPASIEFQNAYMELDYVAGKLDIENREALELENYIKQHTNITRNPSTKSNGRVIIGGDEGRVINRGDLVSTGNVNFIVEETKQIGASGKASLLVECEIAGSVGNVPAETITIFPTAISGINSVTNEEPFTNGYDTENDRQLLDRYYERVRRPTTSGNKYHYLYWAKEVVGVGDAKVIPLWNGDNTVKVIIIDSNKQSASEELIQEVQEHIDPNSSGLGEGQAPIGAFCTVVSADERPINLSIKVTRDLNYSLEQIESEIKRLVTDYLKNIAFKKYLISHAQIGSLILSVGGVQDYSNFTINGDIENIALGDTEVAILGEVVVSE